MFSPRNFCLAGRRFARSGRKPSATEASLPEAFHGLIAVGRLFGQGLADDLAQLGAVPGTNLGQGLGIIMEDRINHGLVVIPAEGQLAREHLVEDDTQRPDVGAWAQLVPACLFGRHVGHGPQCRWLLVSELPPLSLARPKSMTLAWLFGVTMMLALLMSR